MNNYKTEQEKFWTEDFGDEYVDRNKSLNLFTNKIKILNKILSKTKGINSVIELGANIGLNLDAVHTLLPDCFLAGIEINEKAFNILNAKKHIDKKINCSILEYEPDRKYDLSFTMGVLIHIHPDYLNSVYEKLFLSSKKYILIFEYYHPTPVEINYRGHKDRLFKRDFAGEFMDKYGDTELVDYGFFYKRDNYSPADDMTWFLIQK